MYTVFVADLDYGITHYVEGLGNCYRPVAWFLERYRVTGYADYLLTNGVGEFTKVLYQPEDHISGGGYIGEVLESIRDAADK